MSGNTSSLRPVQECRPVTVKQMLVVAGLLRMSFICICACHTPGGVRYGCRLQKAMGGLHYYCDFKHCTQECMSNPIIFSLITALKSPSQNTTQASYAPNPPTTPRAPQSLNTTDSAAPSPAPLSGHASSRHKSRYSETSTHFSNLIPLLFHSSPIHSVPYSA